MSPESWSHPPAGAIASNREKAADGSIFPSPRAPDQPIELLIIQATPYCNIECDYCYLESRRDKSRLSLDTLESVLRRIFASGRVGGRLTVVWHAGEPLVVPASFYRDAFALFLKLVPPATRIEHCIQTNGLLIDRQWCEFFRAHEVLVGVSVDGPAFVHDRHRRTRRGQGTHARVMEGIRLLQACSLDFYVISVLTSAALDHPTEMFEFYRSNGIRRVSFNVEEVEGRHTDSTLMAGGQEQCYRDFFQAFFASMLEHPGTVSLRETERAARAILGPPCPNPPNQQTRACGIVTVAHNGAASTYSPELIGQHNLTYDDFVFLDLTRQKLSDLEASPAFRRMTREIEEGVRRCRLSCSCFSLCGGGAPANKLYETGSFEATETLYCRLGTQVPIDTVLAELERRSRSGEPVPEWLLGIDGDEERHSIKPDQAAGNTATG